MTIIVSTIFFLLFSIVIRVYYGVTVGFVFFILIFLSFFSSLLIGKHIYFDSVRDLLVYIYSLLILFIMVLPFSDYRFKGGDFFRIDAKLSLIIRVVSIGAFFGFLINVTILILSLLNFSVLDLAVGQYKNEKVASEFLSSNIPAYLSIPSSFLTPLGFLSLSIHFIYLIKKNRIYSFVSLLGSMNIFLPSLFVLGRGGLVLYLILYILMIVIFYSLFSESLKFKIKRIFVFIGVFFSLFFYFITSDRFRDYYYYDESSIVESPILYSILHYYSQWIENGYYLLLGFSYDKVTYASVFSYFPNKIMAFFGFEIKEIGDIRHESFGQLATWFNGLPAVLVYDLTFYLTFVFAFFYFYLVRRVSPQKRSKLKVGFLSYPLFMAPLVLFFQGPFFVNSVYNWSVLYLLIIFLVTKFKFTTKTESK